MYELDIPMRSVNKGVSNDGLSPEILNSIPNSLKEILLSNIQKIFFTKYPNDWNLQILHTLKNMATHIIAPNYEE